MKAVEWHPEVIVVRAPTRSEESESDKSSAGSWNTSWSQLEIKISETAIIYQVMISTNDVDEKLVHFVLEVKLNSDFLR
jgi:hypothetical protein